MPADSTAVLSSSAAGKLSDPTFRRYTDDQAKVYAAQRLSYPSELYEAILAHHSATGGQLGLLVDVGCGPGNATRDVARSFDRAIGVDPGEAMIATARGLGGKTRADEDIVFEAGAAEELLGVPGVEEGGVDLLTAAMAAHWFDMDKFWGQAAKALKPGGTIAVWSCSSTFCHPSTPKHEQVMSLFRELEDEILAPYELRPNRLSRDMYDELPLPWTVSPPVAALPREQFARREWDRGGKLSNGETCFGGGRVTPIDTFMKMLGTASMVTRWREAHPDLVGTDEDVVTAFTRRLRAVLGPGVETLELGAGTVLLMFKKVGVREV